MERIRIERKPVKRKRPPADILPLDPHDPDIVRAKALVAKARTDTHRRRAA